MSQIASAKGRDDRELTATRKNGLAPGSVILGGGTVLVSPSTDNQDRRLARSIRCIKGCKGMGASSMASTLSSLGASNGKKQGAVTHNHDQVAARTAMRAPSKVDRNGHLLRRSIFLCRHCLAFGSEMWMLPGRWVETARSLIKEFPNQLRGIRVGWGRTVSVAPSVALYSSD